MQDTVTGYLHELNPEMFKKNPQEAMDAVLPRNRQGPVFHVGEILDIKGGKFRVQNFGSRGRIVLRGVPSV